MLQEDETNSFGAVKSMAEVWEKVQITTTVYATFLICEDILNDSQDIDAALSKIKGYIEKLRLNNHDDLVDWLKRYLHLY